MGPQRGWRPEGRYDRPGAQRRLRRFKIVTALSLLILLVGAILGLLVFNSRQIPPLHFAGIGIGAYDHLPPNAGGRQDVIELRNTFRNLNKHFADKFPPAVELDDTLTGSAVLSQLAEQLRDAEEDHVLVYCTGHGFLRPSGEGTAELFAIHAGLDAVREQGSAELISFEGLLQTLNSSPARRILLCVDVGRLDPDWRLGMLSADFNARLEQEIEAAQAGKVTVLLACQGREKSLATRDSAGVTRGLFGRAIEAALQGECDGVGKGGVRNGVLTARELTQYVTERVGQEAQATRDLPQTVTLLGNPRDFDLMTVQTLPPSQAGAENSTAGKPEVDGSGNDVALVNAASDLKATQTAAATSAEGSKAESTSQQNTVKAPVLTSESVEKSLLAGWKRRDALRTQADVVTWMPHTWKSLQNVLLRADQQWQAGYLTAAHQSIESAEDLFSLLGAKGNQGVLLSFGPWANLSSVWSERVSGGSPALSSADSQAMAQLAQELIEKAAAPPATGTSPAAKADEKLAKLAAPEQRRLFARWLLQDLTRDDGMPLSDARRILDWLAGHDWPAEQWPIEFLQIQKVPPQVDSADVEQWRRILQLRLRWQALLLRLGPHPEFATAFKNQINLSGSAIIAAERWLEGGGPAKSEPTKRWSLISEDRLRAAELTAVELNRFLNLRDTLLAELPDFAYWVANSAESDNQRAFDPEAAIRLSQTMTQPVEDAARQLEKIRETWPVRGGRASEIELKLLHLFFDVRRMTSRLSGEAGQGLEQADAEIDQLRAETRLIDERWNGLQADFQNEVNELLRLRDATSRDLQRSALVLQMPWVTAGDRQKLRELQTRTTVRPLSVSVEPSQRSATPGFWNGFWAIQSLQLAELDDASMRNLWLGWEPLSRLSSDDPSVPRRRAELGGQINKVWSDLPAMLESDGGWTAQTDARLRSVDGWDRMPSSSRTELDERIHTRAYDTLTDAIESYASLWELQNQTLAGWSFFPKRLRTIDIEVAPSASPHFEPLTDLICDLGRKGILEIHWDAQQKPVQLALLGSCASISTTSGPAKFPDPLPTAETARQYQVHLNSGSNTPCPLTVALLSTEGFPWQLQQIRVIPPLDPSQWRIEFATKDGGKPIHQMPLTGRLGTRIFLQPNAAVTLHAQLIRPETDLVGTMAIEVFGVSGKGERKAITAPRKIELTPGQARFEMGAAPLPEGTAPAPKQTPETSGIDMSQGLVFQMTPDGDTSKTFEYTVFPELWPATELIQQPQPTLQAGVLTVPLERTHLNFDPAAADWLIPEEVAVSLKLSPQLAGLVAGQGVLGHSQLKIGQPPVSLFIKLDEQALLRLQQQPEEMAAAEFSLDVGGWSHAFRWRIDGNGVSRVPFPGGPAEIRILSPATGAAYSRKPAAAEQKEPVVPVQLEVYSDALDFSQPGELSDWKIQLDLRTAGNSGNSRGVGLGKTWNVTASSQRLISVEPLQGLDWTFQTRVQDFQTEFPLRDLGNGRYAVVCRILHNDVPESSDRTAVFAVDDTPPSVSVTRQDQSLTHPINQPLTAIATIDDPESGPEKLLVGLDLNGNGTIDDGEPQYGEEFSAAATSASFTGSNSVRAVFTIDDLPKAAGKYAIISRGTNRVELSTIARTSVTIQELPKAEMVKATTGRLTVQTEGTGNIELSLQGPNPQGPMRLKRGAAQTFEDLPPGLYQVQWRAYQRQGTTPPIKIEAGGQKSVSVP